MVKGAAVAGFFLGSLFLSAIILTIFGKKKPKIPSADAESVMNLSSGYYELGTVQRRDGGNVELVQNMAEAAKDTLNGFIQQITYGSEIAPVANSYSPTQVYGHTANKIWVKVGNRKHEFETPDNAIDFGIHWAIKRTEIIGGDLYLKRALHNSTTTTVAAPAGDMQLADDYKMYQNNVSMILAMMSGPYQSLSDSDRNFYNANTDRFQRVQMREISPLSSSDQNWYIAN